MTRAGACAAVIWLSLAAAASADLINPSTLSVTEIEPSRFEVVLTLPIMEGRVLKARPVLPEDCVLAGDANVTEGIGTVIRTWSMTCESASLRGAPIGVAVFQRQRPADRCVGVDADRADEQLVQPILVDVIA